MKTLQQIEPRTPISSLPFTIGSPGAYYLTTNLTGITGSDGIGILAQDVDLDLGGFTLTGVMGSGNGISVPFGPASHITIRNGTLANWSNYGVMATNANNGRLDRLLASGNGVGGLAIGPNSLVENCSASGNQGIVSNGGLTTTGGIGITVGGASRVIDCAATANATTGIVAGNGVVVSGCIVTSNASLGILVGDLGTVKDCSASANAFPNGTGGISAGSGCTITGCTADENLNSAGTSPGISAANYSTIKNCTAYGNGTGINAGFSCNVIECTACNNVIGSGYGIVIGSSCLVRGCVASGNTYNGIVINGNNSAVQESASTATAFGSDIYITGSHNTIIRNVVDTNSVPAVAGIAVFSGSFNAIGTIDTSTTVNTDKNPQANFQP